MILYSGFARIISETLLRDMKRYADMDIDELLAKLSDVEVQQLTSMVDPDDSMIPPSERYDAFRLERALISESAFLALKSS